MNNLTINTSLINVRIDKKTKQDSKKVLESIGLDLSSAIRIFLKTVVKTHSIPFELRTENGFTLAEEKELIKEAEEALKNGKTYNNFSELLAEIDKEIVVKR